MKIKFKKKLKFRPRDIILIVIGAVLYAVFSIPTLFLITFETGSLDLQFRPALIIPSTMAVLFGPWVGGFLAVVGTTIASYIKQGVISSATIYSALPANFICYFLIGLLMKNKKSIKQLAVTAAIGYFFGSLAIGISMYSIGIIKTIESLLTSIAFAFITGYIMTLIGTPILVRVHLRVKGK